MENEKEIVVSNIESSPAAVIQYAIKKDASPEELSRLLDIQERWEANEARKAYHCAMAAFKADPPRILKDKGADYGPGKASYEYASLANVTSHINESLSRFGLSASWRTEQNGSISVICKITHSKGHSEETKLSAEADKSGSKNNIQALGSTITYLQRYTLLSITGLATSGQDDDGMISEIEYIDEKQVSTILDYIDNDNVDKKKFLEYMKIESVEKMPKAKYDIAMKSFEIRKNQK